MANVKNIIGKVFGKLTVIADGGHVGKRKTKAWRCRCQCGTETIVVTSSLSLGNTKSCGCLRAEVQYRHGILGTKEYNSWRAIKERCTNPNCRAYKWYGGANPPVTMCKEWLDSPAQFILDMGSAPSSRHTVDRINGSKIYSKETCKWSTQIEQVRNRSNTVMLTHNGETRPLADWADTFGMDANVLRSRVHIRKWTLERALSQPIIKRK